MGRAAERELAPERERAMGIAGTILLVDDEPFIMEAAARVLRSAGHDVHTCEQWAGVAHIVRQADPDLILLDYNMPSLKGDNVCTILKRTLVGRSVRIVLYSSEPEADLLAITERCGADGYIRKDVPAPELLYRVGRELQAVREDPCSPSMAQ
jgi:CheY-like chemotaxis protein